MRNVRRALLVLLGAVAHGPPDRVRERREPAARARRGAEQGARHQSARLAPVADSWSGSCWSNSSRSPASARRSVCCSRGWLLRGLLALLPNALPRQAHIGLDGKRARVRPAAHRHSPRCCSVCCRRSRRRVPICASCSPPADDRSAQGTGRRVRTRSRGRRACARDDAPDRRRSADSKLRPAGKRLARFRRPTTPSSRTSACRTRRYPPRAAARDHFFGEFLSRARALPGVTAVGLTQSRSRC